MKTPTVICLLLTLLSLTGWTQPAMTSEDLANLDFDGDGARDLDYEVIARDLGPLPARWRVGYAAAPYRDSRFLRASGQRLDFTHGISVDSSRAAHVKLVSQDPLPPVETYGVTILNYDAVQLETWEYTTRLAGFENQAEVLLGLKLVISTGTHYGWIRFARPVVDRHTPFEITGWAYHPVPSEPIPAGEPPPLPPLQTVVDAEGFTFSWDPRWGELVLETAVSLEPPVQWEPVVQSPGGPVTMPLMEEDQRFYRLRTP